MILKSSQCGFLVFWANAGAFVLILALSPALLARECSPREDLRVLEGEQSELLFGHLLEQSSALDRTRR